jgi:deoxyribodipyrimidine photo-lyase
MAAYPGPVLDYQQARRQRLKTLELQRRQWRPDGFSALPVQCRPFGSPGETATADGPPPWWAEPNPALEPIALPLADLGAAEWRQLRSWFGTGSRTVGSMQRGSERGNTGNGSPAHRRASKRPGRKAGSRTKEDGVLQLSLWDNGDGR